MKERSFGSHWNLVNMAQQSLAETLSSFIPSSLSVPSTKHIDNNNNPYTSYTIHISFDHVNKHYSLDHRFSEFEELRSKLSEDSAAIPALPSKTWRRTFDPVLIENRRAALDDWLKELLKQEYVCLHKSWLNFLEIPKHFTVGEIEAFASIYPVEIKSVKDPQFGVTELYYSDSELLMFTSAEDVNLLSKLDRKFSNMRLPWEKAGGLVPVGSFSCLTLNSAGEWKTKCSIFYPSAVSCICYISSIKQVYVGLDSGHIMAYKINDTKYEDFSLISDISGHTARVTGVASINSKGLLISVSKDKNIVLYDQIKQSILSTTTAGNYPLSALYFDADTERCFIANHNQQILIYSFADCPGKLTPSLLHTLSGHSSTIRCLHYNPVDKLLFSGAADYNVGIWTIHTNNTDKFNNSEISRSRIVGWLKNGPQKGVKAVAYLHSLRQVVTGLDGGKVGVWNVNSGKLLYTFKPHQNSVVSLVWLEGPKILLTASLDGYVKFWKFNPNKIELTPHAAGSTPTNTSSNISPVVRGRVQTEVKPEIKQAEEVKPPRQTVSHTMNSSSRNISQSQVEQPQSLFFSPATIRSQPVQSTPSTYSSFTNSPSVSTNNNNVSSSPAAVEAPASPIKSSDPLSHAESAVAVAVEVGSSETFIERLDSSANSEQNNENNNALPVRISPSPSIPPAAEASEEVVDHATLQDADLF
jgi:WD40 repeat protein